MNLSNLKTNLIRLGTFNIKASEIALNDNRNPLTTIRMHYQLWALLQNRKQKLLIGENNR